MSTSSSKRPGPLQELSLARFLPMEPKCVSNPFKCTPKRPRSPGTPVGLLSPTKKRILREEKLFARPEPVKPLSRGSLLDVKSGIHSTSTPSRKLDFGSPSSSGRPTQEESNDRITRQSRRSSTPNRKLVPSPDFSQSHSVQRTIPSHNEARNTGLAPMDESSSSAIPFMIPREIPEISDRQSIHYPGFDIHIDTHTELPSTRRRAQPDSILQMDLDSTKENIVPKRKAKKTTLSELQVVKGKPTSADMCGTTPLNASPTSKMLGHLTDKTPGRTPKQNHYTRQVSAGLTPGRTPVASISAQMQRRRVLEEEVDVPDDETSEETSDA